MDDRSRLNHAQQLMDAFSVRTGLQVGEGDPGRRYLWTDAFAVHAFLGLSHALHEEKYRQQAIHLVELVHEHLGKFHPQDSRQGRISALSDDTGRQKPTIAGLRIGKELPERRKDESYNSRLEWERDGQYFHYLSRWINALLQVHHETRDQKYLFQARDLFLATNKFIYGSGTGLSMYWKMDTELSKPLVPSMGAHDPLEGLLCGLSIKNGLFEEDKKVEDLIEKFEIMCRGKTWATSDPLGIGGLLLNAVRAAQLEALGMKLPVAVKSRKLYKESIESMTGLYGFGKDENPNRRLPFRECGFSLGLQIAKAFQDILLTTSSPEALEEFFLIAIKIEEFWMNSQHKEAGTWRDHLDINSVSLAASLIAPEAPDLFSAV